MPCARRSCRAGDAGQRPAPARVSHASRWAARHGLLPRLLAVRQGLVPPHPAGRDGPGVRPVRLPDLRECLKGLNDTGMKHPPSLLQQTAVGDLVGEGMFVIDRSGKSRVSYRNSVAWRCARPRCSASSDSSAMVCNSGTGTSGPMTAAICTRRLASGGGGPGAPPALLRWCPAAARGRRSCCAPLRPRSTPPQRRDCPPLWHNRLLQRCGELHGLWHGLQHHQAVVG